MADHVFQISGDASQALRASDTVLDRLEAIRKKAAEASQGMSFDKLSQGFARLADAMRQEQQALARTTELHKQLTAANQPLAKSFAGIAEAMKREQEVMQRIHGPMQQYIADVQTLNSLHRQGKITSTQYSAEIAKIRPGASGGGMGGMGLGSLRGGLAAAGVTVGVSEVAGAVNDFQTMQNRLRYLAGGNQGQVDQMFGDLQGVASRTRADLSSTTEAFVRLSLATKEMGLSTSDSMQLTERLNKAIALSGASGTEAAAGMIQLSQGLASGALRGDELRSVMEQLPAVADVIASGMGVTRGELRKLGEDGRITADVIVDAFKKAGTTLDRDFGNTVPTVSQSWTVFKNEMIVTVGELDKSIGASSALGASLGELAKTLTAVVGGLGKMASALEVTAGGLGVLGDMADAFDSATTEAHRLMKIEDQYAARRGQYVHAIMQGAEAVNAWHKEQAALNLQLVLGAKAAEMFRASIAPKDEIADRRAALLKQANAMIDATGMTKNFDMGEAIERELNKAARIQEQLSNRKGKKPKSDGMDEYYRDLLVHDLDTINEGLSKTEDHAGDLAKSLERFQKELAKAGEEYAEEQKKAIAEAMEENAKVMEHSREAQRKLAEEAAEQAARVREAWGQGLGSIAADFVNMAAQGEMSFEKLGESLAKLALQIAAIKIGGPWGAALGSFAGGLNLGGNRYGGDHVIQGRPLETFGLPRAQYGADWRIGGPAGPDKTLVAFWGSRDESVHVRTPAQRHQEQRAMAPMVPRPVVNVYAANNERDVIAAGSSYGAQRVFVENQRKYGRRTR